MHHVRSLAAVALALAVVATPAQAGEIIAHDSVQLSIAEVRDVYLGEKQLHGGVRLLPVNNAAGFDDFLATVLQTQARQYSARWTRKSFREGLLPPAMLGSDAEVIAFVRANRGALGYVGSSPAGVNVLARY